MRPDVWIAKRYLWSKRRHPFVGILAAVSVCGVLVGTAALITVLAVMNGFDEDLKNRIIGMHAHVVVEKEALFENHAEVRKRLEADREVMGVSPFIEGQALVQKDEWGAGVLVRGVDPADERAVSKLHRYLKEGEFSNAPDVVVVGSELAKRARLRLGSRVRVLSQGRDEPLLLRVTGIFSSGMYEYDANLIFVSLAGARDLFHMPAAAVSGLSVRLKDAERAPDFKRRVQTALGAWYFVRTWADMNQTLFSALKLEKLVMFLILALIILVACLNIAGSLTVLVMDKTKDIGVLKALGMRPVELMKIFALDGLWIGAAGALSGLVLGVGLCELLKRYRFVELPKEIYYISALPVQIGWPDAAAVVAVAVFLSLLSAWYPAFVAGRLDPVKALRYE